MTNQLKLRVHHPETNEVVAIEWIDQDLWWHDNLELGPGPTGRYWIGTYPHPGVRRQFTNKVDKEGTEVYAGDSVRWQVTCYSPIGTGVVGWDNDYAGWVIFPGDGSAPCPLPDLYFQVLLPEAGGEVGS